jgi:EAL domain-containing protein (putative c-di-GMP-specific phosphodiesterase class I)
MTPAAAWTGCAAWATASPWVIGSMVELCGDLSIRVISEGVETAGERAALTDLGCELMQGFLFARPARTFCAVEAD